jgi:septal ring factor EnvC (AmiA/AmiB activator)
MADEKTEAARKAILRSQQTIQAARDTLHRLRADLAEQRQRTRSLNADLDRVVGEAVTLNPPLAAD